MEATKEQVTSYPVGLSETRFRPSGYVPVQATHSTLTSTTTTNKNKNNKDTGTVSDESCFIFLLVFLALTLILLWTLAYLCSKDEKSLRFSVDSFSFSPSNLSVSQITADWNISLSVKNSDDIAIFYDTVKASVYYKERFLSIVNIDPFYQGMDDHTMLQASISASSVHVDHWIGTAIIGNWNKYNAVDFNVEVEAFVRIDPGSAMETKGWMRVFCENVRASSNSTTSQPIQHRSRKCDVHLCNGF